MKIPRLTALAVAAALLGSGTAGARPEAQQVPRYRSNQPPVATPPAPAADTTEADAASALESALHRARAPRFVVLWNRQLSDSVTTDYEAVARASTRTDRDPDGNHASFDAETRVGIKALKEGEHRTLATADDWQVRGAFESWLLATGMNLVNRATLVRQSGIDVRGDTPNLQKLEMAAIREGADYIIEVNATPAADAPAGALLRVSVNKISSGRTLVEFASTGRPFRRTLSRWVADGNGYHKQTDQPVVTIDDVGESLAVELAQRLSAAL